MEVERTVSAYTARLEEIDRLGLRETMMDVDEVGLLIFDFFLAIKSEIRFTLLIFKSSQTSGIIVNCN